MKEYTATIRQVVNGRIYHRSYQYTARHNSDAVRAAGERFRAEFNVWPTQHIRITSISSYEY